MALSEIKMDPAAKKLRDIYQGKPGVPFYQKEFGYYCLDRWKEQGMPQDVPLDVLFGYDPPAKHDLGQLGWCEAAFLPVFPEFIKEDRGEYELVQDFAGRDVLYFKGRRNGFMPEYVNHPVTDQKSWEENCKWRMRADDPARYADLEPRMQAAQAAAGNGWIICQNLIGGYMYLRSLIGPMQLLFLFHDQPSLIHDCMQTWLALADAVIERHQRFVTIDEVYLAEDICYKSGALISPEMMRRFLFPYYQELIAHIRQRQLDLSRHLYIQIDTDGDSRKVLPLYQEIGMDIMSPFEVASGCDVVEIGRQYPELVMFGGIDKRILAKGRKAIDQHINYIFPAMRKRGGFYPTCDHGVPEEVPYQDYLYFRKRCLEYA